MPTLYLSPITLEAANTLIANLHRHHKPVVGARFAIGCRNREFDLVGCCVVGRPVARGVDSFSTAEVTRLVTDGTSNACSMLYAAAARACQAMGYIYIQTYILDTEPGTSLDAAGWTFDGWTAGGDWNHSTAYAGKRRTDQPMTPKKRYKKQLNRMPGGLFNPDEL